MDRLIKPDIQTLDLIFTKNQKCFQTFKLTNLMHTMSVAISLTSSDPSIFSFSNPFSIIPPLSEASFTLHLNKPTHSPPLSTPPHTILVRSSMLPTGKANLDDLRRIFSKPGPHIFKDATIPISFTGHHVAEFLLSSFYKSLQVNILFKNAISACTETEITSLLRIATISMRKLNFIETLIEAGADVNHRDAEGKSLISLAFESGNVQVVRVLIGSGFLINNKIDRFLHDAAAMNRVDLMEIMCLSYVDIDLNSTDSQGLTALHIASLHNHIESLQFLVSIGSDPEIPDSRNWTPLHYAANGGHIEAVELLLNQSVFAKYAVTKEGKTAYSLSVEMGYLYLYDMLYLSDLLHRAARIDDVHSMKSCLAQGAKVNVRDQNGWTPLHRAAFKGHFESVKLLVSNGARVDLVDGTGYTPLLRAVETGHVEVAMYLLSNGSKASLKSLKGKIGCEHMEEEFKNHPCFSDTFHQGKEMA